MKRFLPAIFLTACAGSSPIAVIDSQHPASASVPEMDRPAVVNLRADAATRRTRELIANRAQEVEEPVSEGTSSGGQIAKPAAETPAVGSKKGHEGHEHH